MSRWLVERRLSDVSARLKRLRADLQVIDEQLLFFAEAADETRLRALVSETPIADREIAGERRAAVLILTAFSQRDLIEQARDSGALAYLVKPFQKSELIPAIEVALGRFTEMRALEHEVQNLEEQLETRRVVDRAKGRLMYLHHLSQ